jgi:hypothetical protein
MKHRNAHYFLWFLIFGVVAGLVAFTQHGKLDSEAIWLLVTGGLGLIIGRINDGSLTRPYDFVVGIIFTLVGAIGTLAAFGTNVLSPLSSLPSSVVGNGYLLGLSLALFPSLIHLVLGLSSLNHAVTNSK